MASPLHLGRLSANLDLEVSVELPPTRNLLNFPSSPHLSAPLPHTPPPTRSVMCKQFPRGVAMHQVLLKNMTIKANRPATPGIFTITVTGTSASFTHPTTATLTVN
jgi:hypothetical protein